MPDDKISQSDYNDFKEFLPMMHLPNPESVRSAAKFIYIGAVIVLFSPIIAPIYLCYAVGKITVKYWNKM